MGEFTLCDANQRLFRLKWPLIPISNGPPYFFININKAFSAIQRLRRWPKLQQVANFAGIRTQERLFTDSDHLRRLTHLPTGIFIARIILCCGA